MIFYMNLLRNTKFLAGWQQRTLICHMISDIHTEFTSNLTFRDKQAIVAELLYHYINRWKDSIRSNILLSGIFSPCLDLLAKIFGKGILLFRSIK